MVRTDSLSPTLRGRQTRDQLLDATAQLAAERGLSAVGIIDIATAAGHSAAVLYRQFRNKHELLTAVFGRVCDQLFDRAPLLLTDVADHAVAVRTLAAAHAGFALRHKAFVRVFHQEAHQLRAEERRRIRRTERNYTELWCRVVSDLRPELSDQTVRTAVHAVLGLLNSASRLPDRDDEQADVRYAAMAVAAINGL